MFRRIARLILVTVLLANQMAVCCAHSHESESGATPHIHLSWDADGIHSHGHHHGHSHSHDASHSHHAPTKNSGDHDSDSSLNQDSLTDQHEDGLIYCTDSNFFTQTKTDNSTSFQQPAVSCEPVSFVASTADRLPHTVPEDARARYCCGIFLQFRSLRL